MYKGDVGNGEMHKEKCVENLGERTRKRKRAKGQEKGHEDCRDVVDGELPRRRVEEENPPGRP